MVRKFITLEEIKDIQNFVVTYGEKTSIGRHKRGWDVKMDL